MTSEKVFGGSARIYDLLYKDKDYTKEVEFIEEQFGADKSKNILELGCGTGNYLKIFLEKGYNIMGVDLSEEMLEVAREKCDCELLQGDIRDFKIDKKFDVILIMFDVLSYVNDNEGVVKTLENVREHLNEGGQLIFQVWNGLGVLYDKPEKRTREIETGDIKIIREVVPVLKAEKQVVDVNYKYLITNKKGGKVEEINETHSMRFFFPQEIKYFLETCGFETLTLSDFMNTNKKVDETTWHLFCVARKK